MIILRTKRPVYSKNANLGSLFRKAVAGYRTMNRSAVPMQYPPQGYDNFYPQFIKTPEIKVEKPKSDIEKESEMKGIPLLSDKGFSGIESDSDFNPRETNISYDLIKRDGKVFASANIRWSEADSSLVYRVLEPAIDQHDRNMLNQLKTTLIEKLDIDFTALKKEEAKGEYS